jgi:hypothetical protein
MSSRQVNHPDGDPSRSVRDLKGGCARTLRLEAVRQSDHSWARGRPMSDMKRREFMEPAAGVGVF